MLAFFQQQLPQQKQQLTAMTSTGLLTAVTVDSLIDGVHFPHDTPPAWVAHKALAVNLSDLAAMGARPFEIFLSLTLPVWDQDWLLQFAKGLSPLYQTWGLQLSGCHVCKGPLSVTIQAHGDVAADKAMRRSLARPGDQIFVTGTLGDAACALAYYLEQKKLPDAYHDFLLQRFNLPEPRVAIGLQLAGLAHAAIDISDGLAADLGHILEESQVGARVQLEQLPHSAATLALFKQNQRYHKQLAGGDDFELCFTVPQDQLAAVQALSLQWDVPCTCIGEITDGEGIEYQLNGNRIELDVAGYDHFVIS